MTMSRFHTGKAFSPEICDHIRHHFGLAEVAEKNRKQAFGDRDAALSELDELENEDGPEAEKLKTMHSDAMRKIDRLNKTHKWHVSQAIEAARKGDEPEFNFMYDPPESLFTHKKGEDGQMKIERDPTPEEEDPGVPDEVNQHLAASVNELDIPENVREKCIRRGWTSVGVIAGYYDEGADIRSLVDLNENQEATLRKAVKAYCKAHEKAAIAKFKGEGNGPRTDHRRTNADKKRVGKGVVKPSRK